jgi:hypothetical protein
VSSSHLLNRITEELQAIQMLRCRFVRLLHGIIQQALVGENSHYVECRMQRKARLLSLLSAGVDRWQDRAIVVTGRIARDTALLFARHFDYRLRMQCIVRWIEEVLQAVAAWYRCLVVSRPPSADFRVDDTRRRQKAFRGDAQNERTDRSPATRFQGVG